MVFRLSSADLRQLHVFRTVVECNGFSAAQAVLNISQSTISGQMAQLEARLGMRLCDRGRAGFALTEQGKAVYQGTSELLNAHRRFEALTGELRDELTGYLAIGVIDNVVNDPACPLTRALEAFNQRDHSVSISLDVLTPVEIEKRLIDGSLDVAVGTFHHQVPGLKYRYVYVETNELLCGRSHPIYGMTDPAEIRDAVQRARKVTRGYLDRQDLLPLETNGDIPAGIVQNIEASAILILAGGHIGFLPVHYAGPWLASGDMRSILPDHYLYTSPFSVAMRAIPRNSLILRAFLADLEATIA